MVPWPGGACRRSLRVVPQDRATRASKYLAYRLRHDPDGAGLKMSSDGWVEVAALLRAANGDGIAIGFDELRVIVATNDKQRYELDGPGRRIRARQGHSVAVDLGLQPRRPPAVLYHGTVRRFVDSILAEGLRPMGRQYVHLSADPATATDVGGRRGAPVVLAVQADSMCAAGLDFWMSANGVWLALAVPAAFIAET
ncbi:MAG TPA: RNA 2'-phosphotransferase [Acidimicrobiales bacterium]|nr:RNA 2'-phosphotransferase [Acidimicrobiales bacterium]